MTGRVGSEWKKLPGGIGYACRLYGAASLWSIVPQHAMEGPRLEYIKIVLSLKACGR